MLCRTCENIRIFGSFYPVYLYTLHDHPHRPDVQAMHAYAVANATGLIKLDAMENP